MGSSSSTLSPIDNNQFDQEKIMSTLSIIISRLDRMETMLFELKDYLKIDKITEHHHQHPSSDLIEIQTNQQINNDNLQQQQMDLSSNITSLPDNDDDDEEEYFTSVESNDESSKQTFLTIITTNNDDDEDSNDKHQSNVKNTSLLNKDLDSSNMIIETNGNIGDDNDDTVDV
ncbi:hypothetical protein DERP_012911 [Dermatophagoides pteronyssinus]|uniref:Uncharacterized protein n=1 Tax=Dermatophagoides pteronyssinus TaxID=6956 RepID=A0ABQ8J3S3_DERPT|nr:hypothetical protein DERP_012911 [Dermatophagoides pteronyssinus]